MSVSLHCSIRIYLPIILCNILARSPIFTHVSATLQGLSTIRGFKAQEILNKEFDKHQDLHSSAWYIFLSTSTAFGYWLELISVFYIAIVILSFLLYGKGM